MRARADHVAIGQEPAVRAGVELLLEPFFDEAVLSQLPAEMIEAEAEPAADFGLLEVLLRAVLVDRQPGVRSGEFGWSAMLVRRADVEHVVPALAKIPRVGVCRER